MDESQIKNWKKLEQKSKHTADIHNGVIGPNRGLGDYKMVKLETWPRPLDRVCAEGVLFGIKYC